MNRPPKTKLSKALGGVLLTASALVSMTTEAAGLGKLSVNSALGQPLSAEIELVSLQPGEFEALTARVASPEAYTDARVDYSPLLRQLRFAAERRADGKPILKITSNSPVNEPFLDVLVEMNWPAGRLLREYPILLDPPGFNQARVAPPTVATVAPVMPVITKPVSAPTSVTSSVTSAPQVSKSVTRTESIGDTYGPVKRGDTLGKIAADSKPSGVSVEQMLVALYRENKSAFIGNNMNQLKTGQILRVPADPGSISQGEARKEIQVQVADWKGYRDQVASAAAASVGKSATNEASGKIAVAKPAQPTPAAGSSDQLKIAKNETATGKAGAAAAGAGGKGISQDQLSAMKEEAIAKDNKIKEANSRVADLEKQIADMRKLMELKGIAPPAKADVAKAAPAVPAPAIKPAEVAKAEPAKLPPKVEPAKVEPPKAEPAKVDVAKVETAKVEVPKVDAAKTDAPKVDAAKVDVAKVEPPKPVDAPKVAAAPKTPPKAVTPPPAQPDFLEENGMAIGAGAAAVLGIGGLIAFMSRRRKKPAKAGKANSLTNTSSIMPSDLKPNTVTGNRGGGLVDTGNSSFLTDFDKTGPGSIDTDEVDPVAEAEVYIAYGRDAQAEEILKEAMTRDKTRHEIAFKLLEIYHTRKSLPAFETVARELKDSAGVDHPLWAKAAAMGASIDPSNALYGGTGQAFAATGAFAAGGAALLAGAGAGIGAASAATSSGSADKPATPPDLDFDLGFADEPATTPADKPLDITAQKTGEQPAASMDFDLGLNPSMSSNVQPSDKPASLDFDLAFDSPTSNTTGSQPAVSGLSAPAKPESSGFDFDLSGLSLDEPSHDATHKIASASALASPAAGNGAKVAPSSAGMSFSDLSLDLNSDNDFAASSGDGGSGAVATKLELAKAYIEIGDSEGAKEILAEVTREGNTNQQNEAKKILSGLKP